jgi:aspartyl-tRNA(Asn)/glutamyl-tRNA(Gln) amidotransferase subunit C
MYHYLNNCCQVRYNSRMKFDILQVQKVAKLASLPLTPDEEEKFAKELSETLDYVAQLESVDTAGVEPTSQVTGLENITRDDVIGKSFSQEEALKNAKSTHQGYIMVPAILSEDM